MNLTDAADIKINGKEVQQIKIDGNIVYTAGYRIRITTDKTYILTGETATLTVKCEDLPFTQIELYNVIDMVQTKIADLTTDSNGKATYTYTGDGSGEIGFLAKYDEKESNMVIIDDYIPVYHPVLSNWPTPITYGHANRGLVVVARDQHDEKANGVTVVFKEGDTVLDTIVTAGSTQGTMGTATLDLNSLGGGVHTIYAVIGSTSSTHTATITVNKANTSLAISVPALVYSDNFSVTGVLKDSYNTPISGATVRLKWNVGNNEYSATATTNASGEVTFATQAPTSITDYTFQLEFDGNANYNSSTSSVVEKTVGKETSVLSISSPASPASVSGSNFIMTGTLFDNDGEALEGADITVEEYVASVPATVTIATAEVDENGDWSCEIPTTYMDDGDNTITVQYAGNRLYTSAIQSFTVRKVSFDGIDLDSDKSILSKADNEYATLTAQLTYEDTPVSVSGETVSFEVRKESDDSLVETLTADTNSSGVATVYYYGKGTGDLYIKCFSSDRIRLSETTTIEDIHFYDSGAVDHTSRYSSHYNYWGNLSNPTITQENDYYKIVPSSTSVENSWIGNQLPVSSSLDNYELSVDIKTNITGGNNGVGVGIIQGSQKGIGLTQTNSDTSKHLVLYNPYDGGGSIANQVAVSGFHIDDWHTFKLTKNGTTVKFEILYGSTVLWSYTKTGIASNLATQTIPCLTINGNPNKSHWGYYKNIKVRVL